MIESQPVPQKKHDTWIWIVLAIVVLCLCCLIVAIIAGGVAVWKGYIHIPGMNGPSVPVPSIVSTPTLVPGTGSAQIIVEPYQPKAGDNYQTLQSLVLNYQGSIVPSTQTWNLTLSTNRPALVYMGWCTSTQTILDQNFQHIQYLVDVDGKSINASTLYALNQQDSSGFCKSYVGLIRAWPVGKHTLKIIMRFDAQINDGWSDYPAGDYVDVYNVTVTP